jgi:hypothetical protein
VIEVVEQLGSEILLDMKVGEGVMVASVEPTAAGEGARQTARCHAPLQAPRFRYEDRGGNLTPVLPGGRVTESFRASQAEPGISR